MQDSPIQDVNQAADSSDAAPVTTEATAPAGVTAAPSQDGGAQSEQAQGLEFKPVPYQRFREVNQRAREFEQNLARERAEKADLAKRIADYEAKLAKANEEPPKWWTQQFAAKEEVPDFGGDPALEKAWKLEKALEERDRKIADIEKNLAEQRDGFTTYQKQLEEKQQQAKFEAQIDAEVGALTKSDPAIVPHLADVLRLVVDSNGAISVKHAALIWRHENLVQNAPARPAVTAPTAPPMASATVAAPRKAGPGPVTSTPGNLQPARPKATSVSDITERLMARAEAGTLFAAKG